MSEKLKVIFQNEHIVALDKPSGVLTTPARFSDDPRPVLGLQLQSFLNQQIYPIHRLDFEVSGIVLFALSEKAHREFNLKFERRGVYKTYQALVSPKTEGLFPTGQRFIWKSKILRGKKRSFESEAGQWAHTEACLEGSVLSQDWGPALQWSLFPMTGKPHQLRFEMAKQKIPILNDVLYGGAAVSGKAQEIALRAIRLKFDSQREEDRKFLKHWGVPAILEVAKPESIPMRDFRSPAFEDTLGVKDGFGLENIASEGDAGNNS